MHSQTFMQSGNTQAAGDIYDNNSTSPLLVHSLLRARHSFLGPWYLLDVSGPVLPKARAVDRMCHSGGAGSQDSGSSPNSWRVDAHSPLMQAPRDESLQSSSVTWALMDPALTPWQTVCSEDEAGEESPDPGAELQPSHDSAYCCLLHGAESQPGQLEFPPLARDAWLRPLGLVTRTQ